jgi:hypothetical protein
MYYSTVDFSRYLTISSNLIVLDVMITLDLHNLSLFPHYSVMPIDSIVNGALITTSENKLWVLLSPRESQSYAQTNG